MKSIKMLVKKILMYFGFFHGLYVDKNFLKRYLPKNPVIIDAGASHGSDSLEMGLIWPKGHIYAFEPIPAVYEILLANSIEHKNITCVPVALGDKNGSAKIYVSGNNGANVGSSSLLKPKLHLEEHPEVVFDSELEIITQTLDDWALKNNVNHIDMLWLDMQGYELAALKKATKILKTVKVIYTEVNMIELYEGACIYDELKDYLEKEGFIVKKEYIHWKDAGNVLFIRK